MPRFQRILLATDFAASSEAARDHAAALAARHGAELHVLYVHVLLQDVYGWTGYPGLAEFEKEVEAEVAQTVKKHAEQIPRPDGVQIIEATERDASAAPAILRYADEHAADLIVVGTHQRRGVPRLFMGSVAAEVVRSAQVPVLVVGPKHRVPDGCACILAPVDFSEPSMAALHCAADLAQEQGAKLLAVHVVDTMTLPPYFDADFFEAGREQAWDSLEEAVAQAKLPVTPELVVSTGRVHERLVELAADHGADLIVMGCLGLTGLDRLLLGSVTERVLRSAPCPVLAHRLPARKD